ncbi:unnamed protein product [Cunninghamella echinulata]
MITIFLNKVSFYQRFKEKLNNINMTTERFQLFKATTWIEGQIRHRRKCYKALFFIDIQLTNISAEKEKENEKIQVLFRYDDGSMTDIQHQDCFRVTKPGRVIRLHVGPPTKSK